MGNTKIRKHSLDKCFNVYGDLLSSNVPTNMGQLIQSLNIPPPWAFDCCLSPGDRELDSCLDWVGKLNWWNTGVQNQTCKSSEARYTKII